MQTRRRIFLLNRKFQLRFAFYVGSWLIALSFVYPLIISNLFDYFFSYLTLDPTGPELSFLAKSRQELLWALVTMQAGMVGLSFLISIFMSHRIAGPLDKLKKFFQYAKEGDFTQELSFRQSDYFPELAAGYNEMVKSIQKRQRLKSDIVKSVIPKLESCLSQCDTQLRSQLESIVEDLKRVQ